MKKQATQKGKMPYRTTTGPFTCEEKKLKPTACFKVLHDSQKKRTDETGTMN
jgi:hypothetical protein